MKYRLEYYFGNRSGNTVSIDIANEEELRERLESLKAYTEADVRVRVYGLVELDGDEVDTKIRQQNLQQISSDAHRR